jgi:hypothetical protein
MQPIVIIITPGAVIAFTVLLAAVLTLRAAFTRRAPVPRRHGLRELD